VSDHPVTPEEQLLARLRAGDEMAFASLVDGLHGPLLALARTFTASETLAEDIVQETWMGVIRGLSRFEGRSTLRTWIYGILVRRARTLATRDARHRPPAPPPAEASRGPEWTLGGGDAGLWDERPQSWALEDPASILEGEEALQVLSTALERLPEAQRRVVRLRDVEGLPARDVCNILNVSETNQRVLLHRGRAAIRRALDRYLKEGVRLGLLGTAIVAARMGGGS
jgi:RNA polymerase sigma-70 factor, ECF subfamily